MGRALDILVAPLSGSIQTRDQPASMDTAKVSIDERVPGLGLLRSSISEAEMPFGELIPGMGSQIGVLLVGARLNLSPVALEHVLPSVDESFSACDGAIVHRV